MIESHRQKAGKTWGELLDSERARRHLLPAAAARCCGVSVEMWTDWVAGKSHPTGYLRQNLYTAFRTMRAHESMLLREHAEKRVAPLTFKPFAEPVKPKPLDYSGVPFHNALRSVRRHHDLTQSDVASLLDVNPSTLSSWESGESLPLEHSYSKLVELFPEIQTADRPNVRTRSVHSAAADVGQRPLSPDCSLSPDSIAALSPKETPAPMANPAQDSFKDGIKFATLLGSLATGRDGARVLEMLQIAKQRGLSIDDVIASMQEAGR